MERSQIDITDRKHPTWYIWRYHVQCNAKTRLVIVRARKMFWQGNYFLFERSERFRFQPERGEYEASWHCVDGLCRGLSNLSKPSCDSNRQHLTLRTTKPLKSHAFTIQTGNTLHYTTMTLKSHAFTIQHTIPYTIQPPLSSLMHLPFKQEIPYTILPPLSSLMHLPSKQEIPYTILPQLSSLTHLPSNTQHLTPYNHHSQVSCIYHTKQATSHTVLPWLKSRTFTIPTGNTSHQLSSLLHLPSDCVLAFNPIWGLGTWHFTSPRDWVLFGDFLFF